MTRCLEVRGVGQIVGEHDVQQAEQEHEVGAGHELDVLPCAVVGESGGGAAARVDHDEPAALADRSEVLDGRRHRVGQVAAEQQHRVAVLQVGQRERQPAVDAESAVRRRSGRRHAEPAVVVDHPGAQGEPGELAQLVRLLVRQATTAEDGDGIGAVLVADRPDPSGDVVERLVPRHLDEVVALAAQRRS